MANIPAARNLPGIYLQEIDKSLVISPSAALYVAGLIKSHIGEANKIIDIGNEQSLVDFSGIPTNENYDEWFNLARVFLYKVGGLGATLKVVRAVGAGSINGALSVSNTEVIAATTAQLINNRDEIDIITPVYDADTSTVNASVKFFSAYPTDVIYKIALCNATDFATANISTGIPFKGNVTTEPAGTEVCVVVLDEANNILEDYTVDIVPGRVDGYGQNNYIETISEKSSYIYAFYNEASTAGPVSFEATSLMGGVYVAPTTADLANALDLFTNTELVDINYVIAHPDLHQESITLCETRQDCSFRGGIPIGNILGVPKGTALSNSVTYSQTTLPTNTTYGSISNNAFYIFDSYNNKYRWINIAGDMVGLRIRQNLSSQPWYSDGGLNYGQLMEVKKLAQYWDANDQKTLIENKFNPIVLKPGKGTVKWMDSNYTAKKSALKDEGVRELLIYIWRASRVYLEYKLFEFNDEFTRGAIDSQMNRFLQNVQDGRGLRKTDSGANGYQVKCDSENNPSDVINQNMLILDISVLPNRSIHEIFFRVSIAESEVSLQLQ